MGDEHLSVREGRDRYLEANRFGTAAYAASFFPVRVGAVTLRFRNPGLLPWHDLNHVVTGFGTGLVGEAEVSAFELRAGFGSPMVLFLCLGSIAIGLLLSPRRILRAWKRSRGARSLYGSTSSLDDLLAMDLIALRAELGLPPNGIAD